MKVRILAIVVVIVVLAVLASSITACTPKNSYLIQVMKLAPEYIASINCTDIEEMVEDPDFTALYSDISDMVGPFQYQRIGVADSDISAVTYISTGWMLLCVLTGDFNLEEVRNILTEDDFVEGEYEGIEIWTDYNYETAAFIGNMIVYGYSDDIEACIRRHKNEEPSTYDNEDMKSVADRLSSGIISIMYGEGSIYDVEISAGGICLRNKQRADGVLDITGWFKFDSHTSAEANLQDLLDTYFWWNTTDIDAQLRGQFIEFTGEMEISDYYYR